MWSNEIKSIESGRIFQKEICLTLSALVVNQEVLVIIGMTQSLIAAPPPSWMSGGGWNLNGMRQKLPRMRCN